MSKRSASSSTMSLAKRVKRVERRAAFNKPEMKTITLSANLFTATGGTPVADNTVTVTQPCRIAQGTGVNERVGDKIRVWRIEVRGIADNGLDHYIVQNHTSTTPGITSFTSQIGAYLLDSENNKRFTEWIHYRNYYTGSGATSISPLKFHQKFRNGIIIKYNGSASTSVVDNEVSYVVVNRAGQNLQANVSLRMWYTDA